jgi:hypothetical protein
MSSVNLAKSCNPVNACLCLKPPKDFLDLTHENRYKGVGSIDWP